MRAGIQHLLGGAADVCHTSSNQNMAVWASGLRRRRQAPVRKGVGSNPTAVTSPSLYLIEFMMPKAIEYVPQTRPSRFMYPKYKKSLKPQGSNERPNPKPQVVTARHNPKLLSRSLATEARAIGERQLITLR
jgi:hypothetical protein